MANNLKQYNNDAKLYGIYLFQRSIRIGIQGNLPSIQTFFLLQ